MVKEEAWTNDISTALVICSKNENLPCGDVGILARVQRTVEFLVGLVSHGEILAVHLQFYRIVLDSAGKRSRFGKRVMILQAWPDKFPKPRA